MTNTILHDPSYTNAIALVGMSGRFPGAQDVTTFWQNIAGGVKSIHFFSDEELLAAGIKAEVVNDPTFVKVGALLKDVDLFDASFFGYTPREAEIMDPQHRLFLECAWEALEDAAHDPETYRGQVGVFAGSGFSTYMRYNIYSHPDLVDLVGTIQIAAGNERDSLASTVSYKLNLRGPGISIQTFCSTSLVAVHMACQSLLTYECDTALAGGVAISIPQENGYYYEEGGILSPDGVCRTFDADAQGSVMGNGVGVVALKRLEDALQEGDHIYAVVRGSAVNNDGNVRVGYTAPGLDGQSEVIAEALANSGVDPETVNYIETHGTATMLGDSIELAAMMKAYQVRTKKKQFCAIGSVKPNIGHLDRASGVTGLIKAALALQHRQIPPSLNFRRPAPDIDLENSPFYVNTKLSDWSTDGSPRRAGVSSFGLGGTNAHVILEEAPEPEPSSASRAYQLLLLSAKSETSLDMATHNLATYLKAYPQQSLADIAYTLQVGRGTFNHRRIAVCQTHEDGAMALESMTDGRVWSSYQTYRDRGVVFLFPGVGEQYAGMAQDLYEQEAVFRDTVDRCCDILKDLPGMDLSAVLFPPVRSDGTSHNQSGRADLRALLNRGEQSGASTRHQQLMQTALAQPAVFIIEYALAQLLKQWGIVPKAMIGYSLGEYVAACMAGVISLQDALFLVARRAQLIQELPQGAMLAVPLSEAEIQACLSNQVCLAAVNGPRLCVLSGPLDAIISVEKQLQQQEIVTRRLETAHAFHSSMLNAVKESVTSLARTIKLEAPRIPYISNVTGTWITAEQATDPAYWAEHMCRTVRFEQGLEHILRDNGNMEHGMLEVGPGQALTSMVKQHPACKREMHPLVLSTLSSVYERQPALPTLLNALGRLWLAGVTIDWDGFYKDERRLRLSLPTYPFDRKRYWIDIAGIHSLMGVPSFMTATDSLQQQQGKKSELADWFYLPTWEEAPLTPDTLTSPPLSSPCILVFLDSSGIAEQMASRLEKNGARVVRVLSGESFSCVEDRLYTLRPAERGDYQQLMKILGRSQLLPQMVLHCWGVTGEEEHRAGPAFFEQMQQKGFYSLLWLVQALGNLPDAQPIQLLVITNNAQSVEADDPLYPEKAPLLGACRVIPQEFLHLSCRSIDIAIPPAGARDASDLVNALTMEVRSGSADPEVAYRQGRRRVQHYVPRRFEPADTTPCLRQHGVYLITGGLGGVGLVLAEHLARRVQARLVLLGRSGMPAHDDWHAWLQSHPATDPISVKIQRLQAIEALGAEILVLAADVASQEQMHEAIRQTRERFGALHGVIHAAGISEGKAFVAAQEIGERECEWHFAPKVHGLYALEEALAGMPLDFCILFSSLSSVLGGLWLFAYAAANRFMDAYAAQHNRREHTVPWLSVNWDSWAVREDAHGGLGATLAEYTMTPQEGAQAFEYILSAHGQAQIVESTGDLQARIRQWVQLESIDTGDEFAASTPAPAPASLADTYTPASGDYERKIAAVWQQVLGIEQVGLHDNFFDLGGNSLSGLQVLAKLRKELRIQIPVVALFEAPTVSTLARYLLPPSALTLPTQQQQLANRRHQARQSAGQQGIAIIGMSGRFPGASSLQQFWRNQVEGRESVSFFSDEELREAGIDPGLLAHPNYVRARPILENVDLFDASFFGYSPREAEVTDPQHRLFLECAWEALEQAGYDAQCYEGLIGVFGGTNLSNYLERLKQDPTLIGSINDYQQVIGNDKDSLTTSVSYKMNLTGPSYAVQTFCSTSLVATHLGIQSLRNGECDLALAGGVSIRVPVKAGHVYEEGGMESPDGHCRTFDAQARGSMFGDGVALVVLKRLDEALADGDTIYAVIKGSAINNDGSLKVSYTAPSVVGQAEVVQAALSSAGVSADSISYVEAHGTATELGDPIEVASLTKAYRTQTQQEGYCAIGSVKTNVGHLDRAAGVTGLIRVVQALQHEQIPAILHFQSPNPEIDFAHSPFFVNTQLREWKRNGVPRRAGVNSLGMGGTNAHVIVEEAPEREPSGPSRSQQVLLWSARTESALKQMRGNLLHYMQEHPESPLADVAYTLQIGRKGFDHRQALVCESREAALDLLSSENPQGMWTSYQTYRDRPVSFLYTGVGEQYAGMARDLYEQEVVFRETVEYCCRWLHNKLGLDLLPILFPSDESCALNGQQQGTWDLRALVGSDGQANGQAGDHPLAQTAVAQPAVFVIEYALTQLLRQWGIEPKALIGYSLGEYVAACVAGVLSVEDALLLVATRARLIQALPSGAMLAVSLNEHEVQPYLDEQVNLALINGPHLCILAGPVEAIKQLEQRLRLDEITFRRLVTTHAFHSQMLAPLKDAVTDMVRSITLQEPRIPYISNVTGTWITAEEATSPEYWAKHMCRTVRFADGLECLLRDGDVEQLLLEVGPGQALGSMVKQHPACERDRLSLVLSTLPSVYDRQSSQAFLLGTLGKLWLAGVTINWTGFAQGERRHRLPLPTYPFERQRYWLEPRKGVALQSPPTGPDGQLPRLPDIADWFFLPSWRMSFLSSKADQAFANKDHWLLFVDECGFGKRLKEQLVQSQQQVTIVTPGTAFARQDEGAYTIRASQRADYDLLLKELRKRDKTPTRIVHLWMVTPQTPAVADNLVIEEALDKGFYSLLALVQAVGDIGVDECEITIVTNEMQDVTGSEPVCPAKATVMGACRVISQEYSSIRARGIDIVLPEWGGRQEQVLLHQMLAELATRATEPVVALRGKQRWIQTFEEARLEAKKDQPSVLREGGVYLITGGLGGIALAMARHLAQTLRAKLVLTARTGLPPRQEWTRLLAAHDENDKTVSRIRQVLFLEELGAEVLLVTADVADEVQMSNAVQQALSRFGTIHGVFHTAGLPGVGLMQLKKPEVAAGVLATKVAGTTILEKVLQHIPLDFLVLFSSITSMTGGGPGQLDYCAANAFLDAYAHRNAMKHGMTVAINWGEWQWNAWEEGLNGFDQETQVRFKDIRKRFGISFEDGAEALTRILAHRVPHVIVTTQNFRVMRELSKTADNDIDKNRQARQQRPAYPRPLLGVSYASPRSDLEKRIASIWEELLGIEQVGVSDNFFELGGNSLIGIDLIVRLRKELNAHTIPAYALYEAPTVSAMAQYIEQDKTDDTSIEGRLARGEKRRASLKQRMREPGRAR